jgi:hypothetical protein
MTTDAADARNAKFLQAFLDERGGPGLVPCQLRIGVKMAPPSGQPFVQGFVHGRSAASKPDSVWAPGNPGNRQVVARAGGAER